MTTRSNLGYTAMRTAPMGKYTLIMEVRYSPGLDPNVWSVSFDPQLNIEDVEFDCDTIVQESWTMSDFLLHYRGNVKIDGQWLHETIEEAI